MLNSPGHRVRIRDDQRVGLELGEFVRMRASLSRAGSPAKRRSCSVIAPSGGGRAVGPDRSIEIGLDRNQRRADRVQALARRLGGFGGVQPGVVADALAGW